MCPQERRYHSACVVEQQLLVFGGQYYDADHDLHFECDNAVCIYDVPSSSWSALPTAVPRPLRRSSGPAPTSSFWT